MDLSKLLNIEDIQIIDLEKKFEQYKSQQENITLPLGAKNFDLILEGGFRSGNIYLVFGGARTGKTQLCHQICVQGYKTLSHNKNSQVYEYIVYFDTENTFRPERIKELSELTKISYTHVLESILVSNILSNSALLMKMNFFEETLKKKAIKVLIIDTINNHYRSEKSSKEFSFNKTKAEFIKILEKIRTLTIKYNLITVLTAQIASNFIESSIISEYPVGLQYLNHYFSEELYLKHREERKCYAHLVNSHFLPERKILYKITKKGITDFKF